MRVKFRKGDQRKFIDVVLKKIFSPSLIEVINRGIDVSYSSLKNYYSERRSLPEDLFDNLCKISGIDKNDFDFQLVENNFGQIKGGKISRK
ncbi:hypothetical protein K9L16_01180 [Candidatus Pacearchaeota archaeon]|nr:hypothetical protein [Candidatus Pacearchaeota archaeon]